MISFLHRVQFSCLLHQLSELLLVLDPACQSRGQQGAFMRQESAIRLHLFDYLINAASVCCSGSISNRMRDAAGREPVPSVASGTRRRGRLDATIQTHCFAPRWRRVAYYLPTAGSTAGVLEDG